MPTSTVSSSEKTQATRMRNSSRPALFTRSKRVLKRAQTKSRDKRVKATQHATAVTLWSLFAIGNVLKRMKSLSNEVRRRQVELFGAERVE